MASVFGYGMAGALEGLGTGLVAQAEAKRLDALELARNAREDKIRAEDRQNQLADRAEGRAWDISDRNQSRGWSVEDRNYNEGLDAAMNDRNSAAYLDAVNGDDLFDLMDSVEGEKGGNYDTLFGHAQKDGKKFGGMKVSEMTLGELDQFAGLNSEYGQWVKANNPKGAFATPVGRYQMVGTTRRRVAKALGLGPDTVFNKETQDRMGKFLAQERLARSDTPEEARKQFRAEWDGFNNVSDAALDKAIERFRTGATNVTPEQAAVIVDPDTPTIVRDAVAGSAGLGAAMGGKLTGEEWVSDGEGNEVLHGRIDGTGTMKPYTDEKGDPITRKKRNTDAKISTAAVRDLEKRFVDPATGAADFAIVDAVAAEVERLMVEEGMSEIQAKNDAISRMEYEQITTPGREGGLFRSATEDTVENGPFLGTFRSRDAETVSPSATPDATPDAATAAILQQARDAIAAGANRQAVMARLTENGIDPKGL